MFCPVLHLSIHFGHEFLNNFIPLSNTYPLILLIKAFNALKRRSFFYNVSTFCRIFSDDTCVAERGHK